MTSRFGICKTHGAAPFSEPNKNGLSFCLRCLAVQVAKVPNNFSLSREFYERLRTYLPTSANLRGVRINDA